jgi:hypothetical protein
LVSEKISNFVQIAPLLGLHRQLFVVDAGLVELIDQRLPLLDLLINSAAVSLAGQGSD